MNFQTTFNFLSFLLSCNGQTQDQRRVEEDQRRVVERQEKINRLPKFGVCGLTKSEGLDYKIPNRDPTELGAYPWIALIGYKVSDEDVLTWLGTGSLITDQYVITAAHCLHPHPLIRIRSHYKPVIVRFGEFSIDYEVNRRAHPDDYDIDKKIYHEQFSYDFLENNIGLIKLKRKVTFSAYISPICLPLPEFQSNVYLGKTAIVAAWDLFSRQNSRHDTRLIEYETEIIGTETCSSKIRSGHFLENVKVDERVICAAKPGQDSCQGSMGGPLMVFKNPGKTTKGNSGNMFLMGVATILFGDHKRGYPGVYTRVTTHIDWIVDNLEI